jgi:hypothetical protein
LPEQKKAELKGIPLTEIPGYQEPFMKETFYPGQHGDFSSLNSPISA